MVLTKRRQDSPHPYRMLRHFAVRRTFLITEYVPIVELYLESSWAVSVYIRYFMAVLSMEQDYILIKFSFKFPRFMRPEQMLQDVLRLRTALLRAPANTEIDELVMIEFNNEHMRQQHANGSACNKDAYEMPTVQCAQG